MRIGKVVYYFLFLIFFSPELSSADNPVSSISKWLGGIIRGIAKPTLLRDPPPIARGKSNFFRERNQQVQFDNVGRLSVCDGNVRICEFTSCMAKAFKKSQRLENLNLFGQVLADPKFRDSIIESPEVIQMGCREAKLYGEQCRMFESGIKLIDQLMNIWQRPGRGKRDADYADYYGSEVDLSLIAKEKEAIPTTTSETRIVVPEKVILHSPEEKCLSLLRE